MASATQASSGSVVSLWRYPVKSMMGEELNVAEVTERGLVGDRAFAIVDSSDGKVASAKNPRKWPTLFDFRAAYMDSPSASDRTRVRIVLPDGTTVANDQGDIDQVLSTVLEREVTLNAASEGAASAENYWPDIAELAHRDTVTEFTMPDGTFFDGAVINLLTTATIDCLRTLYPQGRFETRRFRPNIVVQTASGEKDFAENEWIGHTLTIGGEVRIRVTRPCARCVMTTLPQGDLPKDLGILGTAAQFNQSDVGVYGSVLRGGTIRRGDSVNIE
jgi:uncharacterized protein